MSMIQTMPVTCPRCGTEGATNIYRSVNVTLDESLKEKLLSGALIKWQCAACGEPRLNAFPLLYHDMKQAVLIQWTHPAYASTQSELAVSLPPRQLCETFLALNRGYRFRIVREFDELVEKIRIFDAGFDDRAIEWIKYQFAEKAGETMAGRSDQEKIGIKLVQSHFRRCVTMEGVKRLEIAGPISMQVPGLASVPLSTYPSEELYQRAFGLLETNLPWPEPVSGHFYFIDRDFIKEAWARLPAINEHPNQPPSNPS